MSVIAGIDILQSAGYWGVGFCRKIKNSYFKQNCM